MSIVGIKPTHPDHASYRLKKEMTAFLVPTSSSIENAWADTVSRTKTKTSRFQLSFMHATQLCCYNLGNRIS